MSKNRSRSVVATVAKTTVATVAAAVFLVLVLIPRVIGAAPLTVMSDSMTPTFAAGDMVVMRALAPDKVCSSLQYGDVIAFYPRSNDATMVTHRVNQITFGSFPNGDQCRIVTKGDANNVVDDPIRPGQVRAEFAYAIPKLGFVQNWASRTLPRVGLNDNRMMTVPAGLALIAYGVRLIIHHQKQRRMPVVSSHPARSVA